MARARPSAAHADRKNLRRRRSHRARESTHRVRGLTALSRDRDPYGNVSTRPETARPPTRRKRRQDPLPAPGCRPVRRRPSPIATSRRNRCDHRLGLAFIQGEFGPRRVVARHLARRDCGSSAPPSPGLHDDLGHERPDLLERNAAGPPQHRRVDREVDDRRLEADVGRTGVENQVDSPVEVLEHVRGGRRARPRKAIRARRGDRNAGHLHQRARDAMRRHAQRHARQSRRDEIGHLGFFRQDRASAVPPRTTAPSLRAPGRHADRALIHLADVRDVHDQRIVRRPLLRVEDFLHGDRIERVRAEAVDGFRREHDELARAQRLRRPLRWRPDRAVSRSTWMTRVFMAGLGA